MIIKIITKEIFPPVCIVCGQFTYRKHDLCKLCYQDLPLLSYSCQRCATPLPPCMDHSVCGQCLYHPPLFNKVYALYRYEFPVMQFILQLKFTYSLLHARVLGELMAEAISQSWYIFKPLPELIIPVPLHPQRLKERGFNQALEIARPIAKQLRIPLNPYCAQRIKYTVPQATLPANKRPQNIKGAFFISHLPPVNHIAIIDDVMTTGQTINELCSAFKQKGITQIDIWCCARPLLPT